MQLLLEGSFLWFLRVLRRSRAGRTLLLFLEVCEAAERGAGVREPSRCSFCVSPGVRAAEWQKVACCAPPQVASGDTGPIGWNFGALCPCHAALGGCPALLPVHQLAQEAGPVAAPLLAAAPSATPCLHSRLCCSQVPGSQGRHCVRQARTLRMLWGSLQGLRACLGCWEMLCLGLTCVRRAQSPADLSPPPYATRQPCRFGVRTAPCELVPQIEECLQQQ